MESEAAKEVAQDNQAEIQKPANDELGEEEDQGSMPLKELNAEEELDLEAFLMKIKKACKNDSSVPDVVGL